MVVDPVAEAGARRVGQCLVGAPDAARERAQDPHVVAFATAPEDQSADDLSVTGFPTGLRRADQARGEAPEGVDRAAEVGRHERAAVAFPDVGPLRHRRVRGVLWVGGFQIQGVDRFEQVRLGARDVVDGDVDRRLGPAVAPAGLPVPPVQVWADVGVCGRIAGGRERSRGAGGQRGGWWVVDFRPGALVGGGAERRDADQCEDDAAG